MSRYAALGFLVILTVALTGCSSFGELPPHWDRALVLEGAHYRLETDVYPAKAERILALAEAYHEHFAVRYETPTDTSSPVRIVVFDDTYDYARFLGLNVPSRDEVRAEQVALEKAGFHIIGATYGASLGHFRTSIFGRNPVIALQNLHHMRDLAGVLRHELSHYFTYRRGIMPPQWYDEGLAEYQRLELLTREAWWIANRLSDSVLDGEIPPPAEILDLSDSEFGELESSYAIAWAFVRYLLDETEHGIAARDADVTSAEKDLRRVSWKTILEGALDEKPRRKSFSPKVVRSRP